MQTPLYPDVTVPLIGQDGNAFFIIGRVSRALKKAGHSDAVDGFMNEAMEGDYNGVLNTVRKYVSIA